MKLFRQAYEQDNGLPVGFTEVEYLESTGTQWIDTGYTFNEKTTIDFKSSLIYQSNGYPAIYGARQGSQVDDYQIYYNNDSVGGSPTEIKFRNGYSTYTISASDIGYTGDLINKNIIVKTTLSDITVTGVSSKTISVTYGTNISPPVPTVLFAQRGVGTSQVTNFGSQRIYYFKIYDGDALVRDFIPCIDPLGVPCMYDLVSKKAYYNQGTGEDFLYGRQIHEVEYLENIVSDTNKPFIDTGIYATENTRVVARLYTTDTGNKNYFGGSVASAGGSASGYAFDSMSTSSIEILFGQSGWKLITAQNVVGTPFDLDFSKNGVIVNGENIWTPSYSSFPTQTKSVTLFVRNSGSAFISGRIYYFKLYDGDTLVRDYIPAIDENGVSFMFDRVSHTAYLNAGSGNFICGENATKYKARLGFVRQMGGALRRLPKGFTEVEYLESTGTQWIDTGLKVNSNTTLQSISETTSYPSSGDAAAPIGARSPEKLNIVYGAPQGTRGNTDVFWVCWGERAYNAQYKKNIIDGQFHEHKINNKGFYLDGTLVYALTSTATISTSTQNIGLFARPGANGVAERFGNYKMKSAKILDNNTLVRDFIPCLDASDTPCMYDIVEGKAYYNKGTGTFLYGEKKPARYLATPKVRLEIPAIYKKLNYIESTGKQYINTGIIGTNANMGIDVDWAFSNNNSNMCIFSSRSGQTSYTLTLFWLKTTSNRMRFNGVGQRYFTDSVNASVSDDIFNFNYKSATGAVATLTNKTTEHIQTLNVGKLETFSTNPLYLFSSRDNAEVYSWIKMYGCKIYDGDTVIRDFIPVLRKSDNKPGMYDKVNKIFYANAASGVDFNYG